MGDNSTTYSPIPICVHTILDDTGSELPGLGCGRKLTVTMDAGGEPAICYNVVIAPNGLSLICTTTAHSAGAVDVTVDNGVSTQILANGYEYVKNESLIKQILSPDTGGSKAMGMIVLGEIVFIAAGIAVFFKLKNT